MDEIDDESTIDPALQPRPRVVGSSHDASMSSGYEDDLNQDDHQVTTNMEAPEDKVGSWDSNQNKKPREDKQEKDIQDSSSELARGQSDSNRDRASEEVRLGSDDGRSSLKEHYEDSLLTEETKSDENISNGYVNNSTSATSASSSSSKSSEKSSKKKRKKRSCLSLNCRSSATNSSSPEQNIEMEKSHSMQNNNTEIENIISDVNPSIKDVPCGDESGNTHETSKIDTDIDNYSTPSVLMKKTEAREKGNDMSGVGSFHSFTSPSTFIVSQSQPDQCGAILDHCTPSKLMQKKKDREVGELISGVGSFSSYTTPSKMMAKLFLGEPDDSLIGSTPSVLMKKRVDREKNEKLAGVGSFQSFTSPSVLVASGHDSSKQTTQLQKRCLDTNDGDDSMESVFSASLSRFISSPDGFAPAESTDKQIIDGSEVLEEMPSICSDDDEEWVILHESDHPLTKTAAMGQVKEESTNDSREHPEMSLSVPAASLITRQLEESLSAPEACIIRNLENTVFSEEFSLQSTKSGTLISELQESLKNLHTKYKSLQENYKQLKVEAENSSKQLSQKNSKNEVILQQREQECRKLQGQLDSVSRKAKHKKDKMAEEFNKRLHDLRNEMHSVLIEKEAIESQLVKARQELTDVQKDKLSSLSQHNFNDESTALKDELEKTKKSLEETMNKLRDICEQAEAEKKEHNWRFRQLANKAESPTLIPGREKHLQQIFHEVQATDGGPDGTVKDHVFFQKVILFIWNQRNEMKQKMNELQQNMKLLDEQQKASDSLELEALQEDLNNAMSENSMMETSFNQTIDQLVSENKELQVKIKHLEKTVSALHHDNNLRRLEVDKIRSRDQSPIDNKTDLTDSRVITLKAEVECVRQHCSLLKAEVSSSRRRNENLMARLTQMEEEGQQYLEQLKAKQSHVDRLEIKIKTLEKQMDRSDDELDKGRSSLTSLIAKKQVADARIKELEKKLSEVLHNNEQLLLENAQQPIVEEVITKTVMASLEHQIAPTNDSTIKQLQDSVYEYEKQVTDLEIELESAKEHIEILERRNKEQPMKHVPQWDELLSDKRKLEAKVLELKETMSNDKKELTELRQEHNALQTKLGLAVQKSEMDGLKKKLQLEEEKMMLRIDVDGKLRSASVKEKGLKQELDEQKRAVLEYEMKINRLQNDLQSKESEASSLNQELAILLSENIQMKKTLDTIATENNNKLIEVGALKTQLQEEKSRNEKTRSELEHMLSLVSKNRADLGQDYSNEFGSNMAQQKTDDATKEELMIKLTEARIESSEMRHKLQAAEKNFDVEQTMNKSMREQHEKSSNEKNSMERTLDSLQVEKKKWLNTEIELNKQISKLCNERDKYIQELLQAKHDNDRQKDLFIEATQKQSDIAEKYEVQLTEIKNRWNEEKKELEEQRDQLKEEKQEMKEKVVEKEGRMFALQETIKQLNKDKRLNLELRTKLASTKTSLSDMQTTIEKLGLERDRYANETSLLQQSLKSAEERKSMMESLVEKKENSLSAQNQSYSEKVNNLNNRLQKTQNSLATVREGLQNARDTNTNLVKERSELHAKLDSLRESWEADRTELALTKERFTNIESKHVKTVALLNEAQEDNKALNSSLLDLDGKYSSEKGKVKVLLEHESELETRIKSYDMRVKILDEQVSYYKKRLSKEEMRLQQAREEIFQSNNDSMFEKQKTIDDLNRENKILERENSRLKQDLTTVRKFMEEQKAELSQIQSSAYDNDVKQKEMEWKLEQLTKELTMEKEMQDKLEKSFEEKDLELRSVKKQLSAKEEKQKLEGLKHSINERKTSDQSILGLQYVMKDLTSEIKSAVKSIPQENDSDDKKKNRELEMKLHVLQMQRLADRETISNLQGNMTDIISKLDRRDHDSSSRNVSDRTSPNPTDICQALARAQVRAYAMSLNESPLYQFENSQHSRLHMPNFSFASPSVRTSTPHRNTQKDFVKKSF